MDVHLYNTDDDSELLEACKKGDLSAFEAIVCRYQRLLLNVAFRMTGVYEDACDIVQDSLIAAWQKIGDFRGDAKISTWLTAIVVNHSRSRLQQRQKRENLEINSLDAPVPGGNRVSLPDPPSDALSALEEMEIVEMHRFLRHCIDALSHEFREVLVLRDMQELAYDQVASTLQLREGTVKSRLFRARDAVRECLERTVGKL